MRPRTRWLLLAATIYAALASAPTANAQYIYPDGINSYGFFGWDRNYSANVGRGLGYYSNFNTNTSGNIGLNQAPLLRPSVPGLQAPVVQTWNSLIGEVQLAVDNGTTNRARGRSHLSIKQARAKIQDRLINRPEPRDVETGNALNAQLDELLHRAGDHTQLHSFMEPLSVAEVQAIPFDAASEAITICLDQLTHKTGWPTALKGAEITEERTTVERPDQEGT